MSVHVAGATAGDRPSSSGSFSLSRRKRSRCERDAEMIYGAEGGQLSLAMMVWLQEYIASNGGERTTEVFSW